MMACVSIGLQPRQMLGACEDIAQGASRRTGQNGFRKMRRRFGERRDVGAGGCCRSGPEAAWQGGMGKIVKGVMGKG